MDYYFIYLSINNLMIMIFLFNKIKEDYYHQKHEAILIQYFMEFKLLFLLNNNFIQNLKIYHNFFFNFQFLSFLLYLKIKINGKN